MLGRRLGLPRAMSGHNSYWLWGPGDFDGSVLIMQGLQQEGTEAAGRFLADPENRRQLKAALGITGSRENSLENIWFEALIRSRTVAGAPNSTTLVAVRRIN